MRYDIRSKYLEMFQRKEESERGRRERKALFSFVCVVERKERDSRARAR
jgi:hypothetical protein